MFLPTEIREERITKIENFLSSIEGIQFFQIANSQTLAGNSIYYGVQKKGADMLDDPHYKVRFSDHSVTNSDRLFNEVHYDLNEEYTEGNLLFAMGDTRYDLLPTEWVEQAVEIAEAHLKGDENIVSTRTTKRGNKIMTVKRTVGRRFTIQKVA